MMHSVEARVPLQDLEVVRAALSVPLRTRLHGGRAKYLLREAFKGRRARTCAQPAQAPVLYADRRLAARAAAPVDPRPAQRATSRRVSAESRNHRRPDESVPVRRRRLSFKVWALLNFQIWYDHVMTI
ncbi:MAG: hypothetical protein HND48_03680 [Chloroflexi bacterium]|nr:hypothetical protein [Chloroflexota bacterium]